MRIKLQRELFTIDVLTILLVIIITLFPSSILRVILGLPFVLFFPGYTFTAALFPRKSDAGGIVRLTLSLGMSVALVAIIALILNSTSWGIRLYPILLSLTIFIIIISMVAWYRWQRLPPIERYVFPVSLKALFWRGERLADKCLSFILAVAIITAISILGYAISAPMVGEKFTEFYILGASGEAADYLNELSLDMTGNITLGIVNHENQEVIYRIAVRQPGGFVEELGQVELQPEQKWEQNVVFTPANVGENQKIEFLLFKGKADKPYRSLHLFLSVKSRE